MRPDALSRVEFDAIVAEAADIANRPHKNFVVPLPSSWRTLTRDKLAAMLVMPGFDQIPAEPRSVLTDQAATWNMFDFTRPSDAAELWNRLWPPNDDLRPNHGVRGYSTDPTWAPTSIAMLAVFTCLPSSIWSAPEDPQVWARRKQLGWQWGNYGQTWDGMRLCLQENAARLEEEATPKAALNQVPAILKQKFGDQLMADGCSRPGPDDCLVLLQALFGLDKEDARLPVILKHIEPSFGLDKTIETPTIGTNAEPAKFDGQRAEVLRRLSFLTLKLKVLVQHPQAWPAGELDRATRQAMESTIAAAQLRGFHNDPLFNTGDFADPWQWLEPSQEAAIAVGMGKLGASYASRIGCGLAPLDERRGSPSFWQNYVVENIRLGHGDCNDIQSLGLSLLVKSDESTRERLTTALQPIATELTTEGRFRERALDLVTEACKSQRPHASDPFKLCAGAVARAVAQAASEPPVDPLECGSELIAATAQALGFAGDEAFWTRPTTACRLDPAHKDRAIVALTYRDGEQTTGKELTTQQPNAYDLDVAIVDIATGNVVSYTHEPAAIPHDAVTFDSLTIDTGRYILAPGKRAFGIRTNHSAHCHDCLYDTKELALYLPDGKRLSKILSAVLDETQNDPTSQCPDGSAINQTTLSVGSGESHGLADLVLSTVTTFDGACWDKSAKPGQATSRATLTLRFDGHRYPMAVP